MNAEERSAARELETQLPWQGSQASEQAGLIQDAASPADASRHGPVALHEIDTRHGISGGRVRRGLLPRQDVAVRVPAQHADARQALQKFKYLGRARAEKDQITQRPPAVNAHPVRMFQHRAQRDVVAVDVSDDSQLHERKPIHLPRTGYRVRRRGYPGGDGFGGSRGAGHSLSGSKSRSLRLRSRATMTSVSMLAGSIWRINSRHRPQGGRTYNSPLASRHTATILAI